MNGSDVYMTQDNFILPASPVGGLPIFHDRLDRMKLVRDRTTPVILSSEKNILADKVFKIITGIPTLTRGKSKVDLAAESAFSLPLIPIWLDTKTNIFIGKL